MILEGRQKLASCGYVIPWESDVTGKPVNSYRYTHPVHSQACIGIIKVLCGKHDVETKYMDYTLQHLVLISSN